MTVRHKKIDREMTERNTDRQKIKQIDKQTDKETVLIFRQTEI